jgi:hypothetical protein
MWMQMLIFGYFLLGVIAISSLSLNSGLKNEIIASTNQLKSEILDLARRANRGLKETAEERKAMFNMFEALEQRAPMKDNLNSPYLQAIWKLEYSTNDIIIGRNGFTKVGDILQYVNVKNLKSQNREVIDFFGLKIPRHFTAKLTPLSSSKVS